jgi:hypothetical protein
MHAFEARKRASFPRDLRGMRFILRRFANRLACLEFELASIAEEPAGLANRLASLAEDLASLARELAR